MRPEVLWVQLAPEAPIIEALTGQLGLDALYPARYRAPELHNRSVDAHIAAGAAICL